MRPYLRVIESADGRRVYRTTRRHLEKLVREELRRLSEAEKDDEGPEENDPRGVDLSAAGSNPQDRVRARPDPESKDPEEVPDAEDPADDEVEADGRGEPGRGRLADELVGKTVQSITMEPKSKLIPGAEEVVLTFNEITDPLRILVSKNGKISFFFRSSLHNLV